MGVGNLVVIADKDQGRVVELDPITDGIPVISIEHNEIHCGDFYTASAYDADVDQADNKWYGITVGATKKPHMKLAISASASGLVQLFENSVYTDGTSITAYNNNRESSGDAASITLVEDPTVTTSGDMLQAVMITGASQGPTKLGGNIRQDSEWILDLNKVYVVHFNPFADNTKISFNAEWYEEI